MEPLLQMGFQGPAFLQESWAKYVHTYSPGMIEFQLFNLGLLLAFWIPALVYLGIDLCFPAFSNRHKIQSERRQPSWPEIQDCMLVVLKVNVTEAILHLSYLRLRGGPSYDFSVFTIPDTIPSLGSFVWIFAIGLFWREITFYYSHRALHHPLVYKHVHKKHHVFTAPMAFSAQYAHPFEHVISNVMPIVLPLALMRVHILPFWIFYAFELWEAAADHSGYDFVKLPPARLHDEHHEKFRMNYGTVAIMDWLHGTNMLISDKKAKQMGNSSAVTVVNTQDMAKTLVEPKDLEVTKEVF